MSIDSIDNETLWAQKYRPQRIADTILPSTLKATLQSIVDKGTIPNLMFYGPAGTGKTTAAMAMCEEIEADYIVINASLENGIDVLRGKIMSFASTVSLMGGRKYIILDEADYLTQNAQPALRGLIEHVSSNCGFILTCNYKAKLIDPLQKRFEDVVFGMTENESKEMTAQFLKRVVEILKVEKVEANPKVVVSIIKSLFPNFRSILNKLQFAASTGKIDETALVNKIDESIDNLFAILKAKKFAEMRQWAADNADIGSAEIFRKMYDKSIDFVVEQSLPEFIIQLGEYQYKHAFVADPEINMVAFLTTIMIECEMK